MKKIFSVMILAAIIFLGGQNKVSAEDYYVGNFDSGLKAYVMSETLDFQSMRDFAVRVKAVNSSGRVTYIDYEFFGSPGEPESFSDSQGHSGTVRQGTVENNIYSYAMKIWGDKVISRR